MKNNALTILVMILVLAAFSAGQNLINNDGIENASKLVASYPLNGNAQDVGPFGISGIMDGCTPTENRFGEPNSALYFDGISDMITIPDTSVLNFDARDESYTISLWVKSDSLMNKGRIFQKWNENISVPYPFTIRSGKTSCQAAIYDGQREGATYISLGNIWNNSWRHLTLTVDHIKKQINGYLDGNFIGAETFDFQNTTKNNCDTYVAAMPKYPELFFEGNIDDIKIFHEALDAEDVQRLYREGMPANNQVVVTASLVNSFPGDTIDLPVKVELGDYPMFSSIELNMGGFQEKLDLLDVVTDDGLFSQNGWSLSQNKTDSMLYLAAAGASEITQSGTLFWLRFAVPDSLEGLAPVNMYRAVVDTSSVTVITRDGGVKAYYPMAGDVDLNSRVQAYDAAMILKYLANGIDLDHVMLRNAEVSGDTTISALDASLILQYVVGNVDSLPLDTNQINILASGDLFMEDQQVNIGKELEIPVYLYDGQNIMSYQGAVDFNHTILEYQSYELSEAFKDVSFKINQGDDGQLNIFAANSKAQDMVEGVLAYLKFKVLDLPADTETIISINEFQWNECAVINEVVAAKIQVVTTIDKNGLNTPKEFLLEQNYPNPFNPQTTIRIHIPKTSEIKLVIYNILGQKIRTLYQGQKAAGIYQFVWKGKNELGLEMSTGTYIMQLQSEQITINKKVQLIR